MTQAVRRRLTKLAGTDLFDCEARKVPPYTASSAIYDHMMREVDYGSWAEYIITLVGVAGRNTNRRTVQNEDLCEFACGTGNISFKLLRSGFRVTGVDSSGDMIAVARSKIGKRDSGRITFIREDMTNYSSRSTFDVAVCVYDSMNYIPSEDRIGRFFGNVYESLKPGGVFVFDASLEPNSLNPGSVFTQHGKHVGIAYQRRSSYDRETKVHTTFVRIRKGETVYEETHREYVYRLETLRRLFTGTGFKERAAVGDFTLLDADNLSERVHFVLVK